MKKTQAASFWDNAKFPVAVAHRGGDAAGIAKENSLKAFQAAYALGYRWFETDVVSTKDNVLLAIHGRGLQRQPNKDLPTRLSIQKMTYAQARKKVRVGNEEPLTLKELLDSFPDTKVFIDPKTFKTAPVLADFLIKRPQDLSRICVGSFHGMNTNLVKKRVEKATGLKITCAAIGVVRGSLLVLSARSAILRPALNAYIAITNVKTFYLPYKTLAGKKGKKIINLAHDNSLKIAAYTPNNESSIKSVLSAGVDAVMSDNISLLKKYVKP